MSRLPSTLTRRAEETAGAMWKRIHNMPVKELKTFLHDDANGDIAACASIIMKFKGQSEFYSVKLMLGGCGAPKAARFDFLPFGNDEVEIARMRDAIIEYYRVEVEERSLVPA